MSSFSFWQTSLQKKTMIDAVIHRWMMFLFIETIETHTSVWCLCLWTEHYVRLFSFFYVLIFVFFYSVLMWCDYHGDYFLGSALFSQFSGWVSTMIMLCFCCHSSLVYFSISIAWQTALFYNFCWLAWVESEIVLNRFTDLEQSFLM